VTIGRTNDFTEAFYLPDQTRASCRMFHCLWFCARSFERDARGPAIVRLGKRHRRESIGSSER
jgi:hypothetical protein